MARFTRTTRPQATNLGVAERDTARTHEGAPADTRDARSELFVLAVTNLVGQDTFYERANARDERFRLLVREVTATDPEWVASFVPWLRDSANMRTAAIVAAVEYCLAGGPEKRRVISGALQRGDEPAEFLGYWIQRTGRHTLPGGVQRGLRDAVERLYTERAVLRYDSSRATVRMGDVVELVKPRSHSTHGAAELTIEEIGRRRRRRSQLYDFLYDSRRNRPEPGEELMTLRARRRLEAMPPHQRRVVARDSELLRLAAVSWEYLAGWLPGGMDAQAWELAIPEMGYMALLRNLRNFEQAGVSRDVLRQVEDRLRDPDEVRKSRQLPIRFLSAWKAVGSTRWGAALEDALSVTFDNVPRLTGRSLVLVDMSGSMKDPLSERSQVQRWEAALLFGHAAAWASDEADLFVYSGGWSSIRRWSDRFGRGDSDDNVYHRLDASRSPLRLYDDATRWPGAFYGTRTWLTVEQTCDLKRHDRLVLVTDEQSHDSYRGLPVPKRTYVVNVAGYHPAQLPPGAVAFGGLSDAVFAGLAALESRHDERWPWDG